MPTNPNSTNTRPAQILLREHDRNLGDELMRRAALCGRRVAGPTAIYRAGLLALTALSDSELSTMFDQADDRPTPTQLQARFREWCADISNLVCQASPRLQYAWSGERDPDQSGHFSDGPRFVHLSMMQDGRVLISGMQAALQPIPLGGRIPNAPVLFPGGLATMLSINEDGAELAARAVTTWLLADDEQLDEVRAAMRRHQADPLR